MISLTEVVEQHNKNKFHDYSHVVFHSVINDVMKPIENAMHNGLVLDCADGVRRVCVPVLCQYIADMEEQWKLTCLIQPSCTKCFHRHVDLNRPRTINKSAGRNVEHASMMETDAPNSEDEDSEEECDGERTETFANNAPDQQNWSDDESDDSDSEFELPPPNTVKTDRSVARFRLRSKRDPDFVPQLKGLGLHQQEPFSAKYPFGGILDAVCPDLLHQISKCFMDHLLDKWIVPLMYWYGEKQQPRASNDQVNQEFDARFALMPSAMQLRRFPSRIFADNHHWTVDQLKNMMKIIIGALVGICPPEGIDLTREYLHIHFLSHYNCHTDGENGSLDWLESAIEKFFCQVEGTKRDMGGEGIGYCKLRTATSPPPPALRLLYPCHGRHGRLQYPENGDSPQTPRICL